MTAEMTADPVVIPDVMRSAVLMAPRRMEIVEKPVPTPGPVRSW